MATLSSTLAWKIPWMEQPVRLQSMESLRVGTTERLPFQFSLLCIGEGNGNSLQCSCLENPRDGGVWWAVVYGVAQSHTQLKRLGSRRILHDNTIFQIFNSNHYQSLKDKPKVLIMQACRGNVSEFRKLGEWLCRFFYQSGVQPSFPQGWERKTFQYNSWVQSRKKLY